LNIDIELIEDRKMSRVPIYAFAALAALLLVLAARACSAA